MATQSGETQLRKTGIGVVGDVPWGTHFFMFYHEGGGHWNGTLHQPFHNRVAWRTVVTGFEFPGSVVRIHSAGRGE